jgi:hypothetical protein
MFFDGVTNVDLSITIVSFVDGWRDNNVLTFYTNIYCIYTERTNELWSEDMKAADRMLQVAGC